MVLAVGFTSSKHNFYVGLIIGWIDCISQALLPFAYFQLMYSVKRLSEWQYNSMIFVVVHMTISVLLFFHDIYFQSDEMFCIGTSSTTSNNVTTVTTFGISETNSIIEPEEDNCCCKCINSNPWALYRKHYIICLLKITLLATNISVLILFNSSWECRYVKCD